MYSVEPIRSKKLCGRLGTTAQSLQFIEKEISVSAEKCTPLIEVEHLSIDFWNQQRWVNVVNDVTFAVRPSEALGLVGESGCGKTTTAYTLLGYRRPNSRIRAGRVHFGGRDLLRLSSADLRRIRGKQISLVPQNPTTALSPGMSVGDQIHEVLNAHDVGAADERRDRVYDLLRQVRLPDPLATARKFPHQLSGGQQQRVVIAMALACKPDLLVLDEPTTGLDVTTQSQIIELFSFLRAEHGMAMIYVTHDLGVIAQVCDRVGVMYAGELVEDAPTAELFRRPRHPYTRGLIASVPSIRLPRKTRLALRGFLQRTLMAGGCRFAPRCDFALDRCYTEPQTLALTAPDHRVACWRAPEIAAAAEPNMCEASSVLLVPTGDALLRVEHIDVAYHFRRETPFSRSKAVNVVHNVSFDIKPQETFSLVGESGSGKSTIARAIAGLLVPSAGKIVFENRDITQLIGTRTQEQRREIQLVFQNPDASLNPRQTVMQILGRPLQIFFGLTGSANRRRVEQLLEDVRLDSSYARRYPDELSGGERQRIAIARALAAQPRLMLCDEILSALDVSVQSSILDLLQALQAEHHLAYLFISHDLAVVRSISHRVGVLYRGELCEVGLVEEVYSPPYHPYTHMLLSAVPEIEDGVGKRPTSTIQSREEASASTKKSACPFADRCPWKLGAVCDDVPPPWQANSATHALRCHIPQGNLI